MAQIDSLEIQIKASATDIKSSVDRIEKQLGRLKTALNFNFGESLSKSLSTLGGSLDGLNGSISRFDAAKLKNISDSLKSLSKLSQTTEKTARSVQKSTSGLSQYVDHFAGIFKEMYNLDDSGFDLVKSKIAEMASLVEKGLDTTKVQKDLKEVVEDNYRLSDSFKSLGDDYRNVRDILNANTIRIPEGASQNIIGNWKEVFGNVGIRSLSKDRGIDPSHVAQQLTDAGYFVDDTGHEADILQRISDLVSSLRPNMEALARDEITTKEASEQLTNAVQGLASSFKGALENMKATPVRDMVPQESVSSLENIASSLQSLSGVNISAESMSGINTLANAMGRLGGQASGRAAQSLPYIAEGIQSLNGIQIPHFGTEIDELAASLSKLGSVRIERAGGLSFVAQGLRDLKSVGDIPEIKGLTELAQSLSMFGRKTAETAVTTIPQLATAFRQLITTLSTAPTVSRNTIDLANALANLAAQGGKSNSAISALTPRISGLGSRMRMASRHGHSLASTIGKIYATYWLLIRAFGKIKQSIDYASSLTEVQNVVDTVFGDAKEKVEDFADTAIMSFGMSELSAKQFASRFQAMGTAMGITNQQAAQSSEFLNTALEGNKRMLKGMTDSYADLGDSMADVSINLTKLAADMGSFYNVEYEDVAKDLESIFTGMTRPMRQYGVDLTEANLKEWALTHGLNANMKTMTQAEKAMLRYQYTMERMAHAMNDYQRTADTWANVTRTIGQQFIKLGSIIGKGFINAFRPMLVKFRDFMNTLIDLVEKGMNAIGKLLGWQIEISDVGLTDDAEAAEDLADGLGGAADNAKELNKQLMGFDKLNNISLPSDGGGGGGGGATGGGAGGDAGKATDAMVKWKKYESDIETWRELGESIADKLSDAMESIDWDSIYDKASNFGTNLAEFMNGLFTGEKGERLFENLGSTIAGSVNTVFKAWESWADDFEFGGLGKAISKGIKKFLERWEPETAGWAMGKTAGGIANALYAVVSDKETWKLLGKKIADGINGFLAGMSEIDAETGLSGWEAAFGDLAQTLNGIVDTLNTALADLDWSELAEGLGKGLKKFFEDIEGDTIIAIIGVATLKIFGKRMVAAIGAKLSEAIATGSGSLAAAIGASSISTVAIGLAITFVVGTIAFQISKKATAKAFGEEWIGEMSFSDMVSYWFDTDDFKSDALGALKLWGEDIKQAWKDIFTDIGDSIWGWIEDAFGEDNVLVVGLGLAKDEIKLLWKAITEKWGKNKILRTGVAFWRYAIKKLWLTLKNTWGENKTVKVFVGLFKSAVKILWTGLKEKWGVSRTLKVLFSYFSGAVKTLWKSLVDKWGTKRKLKVIFGILSRAVSDLWNLLKTDWGLNKKLQVGFSIISGALSDVWNQVQNFFSGKTVDVNTKAKKKALGGTFYNGKWHNIAQYASGGYPSHGTAFIAGEAGAEVVGHIGGRTEVLNESQLASVMYDAVSGAMAAQNQILIKQNQYLAGILAKDYGISESDIFRATQKQASQYVARTGRPAFGV